MVFSRTAFRGFIGSALLVASVSAASADMWESQFDLDGVFPEELLVREDRRSDGFEIDFWSEEHSEWLRVFEGVGEPPTSQPREGAILYTLIYGGREWLFQNNRYEPQIQVMSEYIGSVPMSTFDVAMEAVAPATGENTDLHSLVRLSEGVIGVLLGGGDFCSMGGLLCPLVVISEGEGGSGVVGVAYVNQSTPWGVSEMVPGGDVVVEDIVEGILIRTNVGRNEVERVFPQAPRPTTFQLEPPEGVNQ